jgi:hypothetical protein
MNHPTNQASPKNMADTVFIFGAGFSKDAGIPLLGNFVDRMWELTMSGRHSKSLSKEDHESLTKAMKVVHELDSYHGRANFNDRNIEDILSILTFNVLAGGKRKQHKLVSMTNAIARTIEICCDVKCAAPENTQPHDDAKPSVYRDFWQSLFDGIKQGFQMPTILTFNYDLVLERSLLQTLNNTRYANPTDLGFRTLSVNYHYKNVPDAHYQVNGIEYIVQSPPGEWKRKDGTKVATIKKTNQPADCMINILKLHGSLNFPIPGLKPTLRADPSWNIEASLADPYILPPVFNKFSGDDASSMWITALTNLRAAKNVVIVGYSLPQTDIYMQYFLKAALGPNQNLNKLIVFDPVLHTQLDVCDEMKKRYASCFSSQLQNRIEFQPKRSHDREADLGTTKSFVQMLRKEPSALMFS